VNSLDDVYRKFGEASEAAQLLETELGTVLLEHQAGEAGLFLGGRGEEAAALLEAINSSTLGTLLRRVEGKEPRLAPSAEVMARALAYRNRLAHSFFRQHNFRRNTPEGCAIMLADLEAIHQTILAAYKVALALSGIDLDALASQERPGGDVPTKHLKLK
jgi:hypothetical protein